MAELAGKRALISGGAAGIGRAIGLELAAAGCDIALLDVDAVRAQATATEIRRLGRDAAVAEGDVAQAASVQAAVLALEDCGPTLDILIKNAGIARLG